MAAIRIVREGNSGIHVFFLCGYVCCDSTKISNKVSDGKLQNREHRASCVFRHLHK